MLTVEKLNKYILLIGIFFIPFNSFEGVNFLGEFRNESAAYFFLIGFVLYGITVLIHRKISIPYKNALFQILLLFLVWCIIATLFNIHTVSQNYFKQTGGINRFIRQYASLILSSFVFFLFYWNVLRRMSAKEILLSIRKVLLFSLIVASIYGAIETLIVVFHIYDLIPVLVLFNYFPFLEVVIFKERISSISYEAPFLAIYLITIAGWMFSYILTSRGIWRFVPTLLVLELGFFSGSRTALVVLFVQLITFACILLLNKKYRKYLLIFFGGSIVLLALIVAINSDKVIAEVEKKIESLNFKENLTESVSNKSRIGMQVASLQVAKEHPIVGVGFGQQAYHNRFHYPRWATKDNYEFDLMYKNENITAFPPGYNLYIRILTETGVVGLIIFAFLIVGIFYTLYRLYRIKKAEEKVLTIILLISFIGACINFVQIDTFRLYGFWISLAILIKLMDAETQTKKELPH